MMNTTKSYRSIFLSASIALSTAGMVLLFQNCSAVDFDTFDELDRAGVDGELRRVTVDPKQTESRPDVDVITILDNSFSMNPILTKTQNAFNNITNKLRGFNGSVAIYTTTQSNGDKISTKTSQHVEYRDDDNNLVTIPMENYEANIPPLTPYSIVDAVGLSDPHTNSRALINFNAKMNNMEFTNFTNDFTNSIGNIGVDGADSEQGVCVLLRTIEANRNKNSFPVYLIATNEDDDSSVDSCLKNSKQQWSYAPDDVEAEAQCEEGDLNCNYSYKMDYNPTQNTRLYYTYRSVSEALKYELLTPEVEKSIEFKWDKYKAVAKYRLNRKKLVISYEPYIIRDNIKAPKGSMDSKDLETTNGQCESNLPIACTDGPEGQIEALDLANGLVEGTCSVTCSESVTSDKYKTLKNWTVGLCSDSEWPAGTNNCELSDYAKALNDEDISYGEANNIFNRCSVTCSEGTGSKEIAASTNPNRCEDLDLERDDTCLPEDRDQASAVYNTVSDSDIKECTISCSEEIIDGSVSENTNIDQCKGVDATDKGNYLKACNVSQIRKVADDLGIDASEIANCDYTCNQSQVKRNRSFNSKTSCELGSVICAPGSTEQTRAEDLSAGPVTACSLRCSDNRARNSCRQTLTKADSCAAYSPELTQLEGLCHVDGETLKENSCKLESALKTTYSIKYVKQKDDKILNSYLSGPDQNQVANSVRDLLHDVHGENFFLTSFIYPPGDDDCKPVVAGLSEGAKFSAIDQALSPTTSAIYPNCMDDYSPALEVVFDQIVHTMNRTYSVELDTEVEWVWSVYLSFTDGSSRRLQKEEFSVSGKILTISESINLSDLTLIDVDVVTPEKPK